MLERLSQKDVDRLLHGEIAGGKAEPLPWSFSRPTRLPRERRVLVEGVYAEVARAWQAWLASRLQTPVEVSVVAVETVPCGEFLQSIASPAAAFVFRPGGAARAHGVADLGADIAFAIVDRLLGGEGATLEARRPLTALEQTLVRGAIERLLAAWRDAWKERASFAPEIVSFEPSGETVRLAGREDVVLAASLGVRATSFAGLVTLGVPLAAIESAFGGSPAEAPAPAAPVNLAARAWIQSGLQQARVRVAARMPAIRISARALGTLRPGQVIETGLAMDSTVEVVVNGRPRFIGVMGQRRRRLGLRIVQTIVAPESTASRGSEGRIQ